MFHVGLDVKPARFLEQFHPHGHREKQHDPDSQCQTGFESLSHFDQDHAGQYAKYHSDTHAPHHIQRNQEKVRVIKGDEQLDGRDKGLFISKILADFQFADLGIEGGGFEV